MSKKKWIIGVVVLAGAAILGSLGLVNANSMPAEQGALKSETIKTGNLELIISASGKVHSGQTVNLTWQTAGTVENVQVEVGQAVQSGHTLASLEQTSLPQAVILAQADLTQAQQALDDLYQQADMAKASAMQAISKYTQEARDAQYQLDNFSVPSNQQDMDTMDAITVTSEELNQARQDFEPYRFDSLSNQTREDFKEALDEAQSAHDSAVRRLEYEYALAVARANLQDAMQDYETWKDGPRPEDIAAAQARVAAAQAILNQASIQTPITGIVTVGNPKPGDKVIAGTQAFQIDDLSKMYIDIQIPEIDINQVQVGQPVRVVFDAIRDKEYTGKLTDVGLVGIESGGVTSFVVTVELSNPDESVRAGMTSDVEVQVTSQQETLLIPNQAVRIIDGSQVVYVLQENGEVVPIPITLGNSSTSYSELLTGALQPGDKIVLNPAESVTASAQTGMFGQMRSMREAADQQGAGAQNPQEQGDNP